MLYTNDLKDIYPNVTTYVFVHVCNKLYSRAVVFSIEKRVKSHLRSTLESDKLNVTSILHIESEML